MKNRKIYGLMTLTAFFWAGGFIAGKFSIPWIPTFSLTFFRFFIATVILFFIVTYRGKKEKEEAYHLEKKHIPVFLFTGMVGMFGYHVCFFIAIQYTTAINSSIIGATNPIITTIIAAIFLTAKIPRRQIAGIFISFIGVILTICGANLSAFFELGFNKGDLWMLAAALCWSCYVVFSKSRGKGIPPLWLTYYSFLICTLGLVPFVIWERPWTFFTSIPLSAWAAVLYMGVFSSVVGYLIQQIALKEIGPSRTSVFSNLVPVFSMALAVWMLGEPLEVTKVLATGIIIAGVCICQFKTAPEKAAADS